MKGIFWDLLEAELPELAGRAVGFLVEQKEDKIKAQTAWLQNQHDCNSVFISHLDEAILQPIVTAFDLTDFQYSTDPASRYQSLFSLWETRCMTHVE